MLSLAHSVVSKLFEVLKLFHDTNCLVWLKSLKLIQNVLGFAHSFKFDHSGWMRLYNSITFKEFVEIIQEVRTKDLLYKLRYQLLLVSPQFVMFGWDIF